MPPKQSAGLLLFRRTQGHTSVQVLLAHPGGPYWQARHEGAWTLPKGGIHSGEAPLQAAIREFRASMDEGIGEVSSLYHLAMIHRARGDEQTATTLLERAREFGRAAAAK